MRGRFPLSRDGRFANRPYGAVGDAGCEGGLRWRCAAPSPLWIPAFAGMTVVGALVGEGDGGWGRFPLSRDGRFANRPYGVRDVGGFVGVPACAGTTGGGARERLGALWIV